MASTRRSTSILRIGASLALAASLGAAAILPAVASPSAHPTPSSQALGIQATGTPAPSSQALGTPTPSATAPSKPAPSSSATALPEPNAEAVVETGPAVVPNAEATKSINLINFNDFHGRIDQNTVGWAGTIEQLRAQDPANTLMVSAGDSISASLFASSVQDDRPTVDVLNEVGLEASAAGNHEFDRGYDALINETQEWANFPTLGANVYLKDTGERALPSYYIADVNGTRVAVIGAVTQETATLVSPQGIENLEFRDPVASINEVVTELKNSGEADVILATLHEGAPDGSASYEEAIASSPVFKNIAEGISADVAAIVTGHTHQAYTYDAPVPGDPERTRPIIQTGNYGEFLGNVTLNLDDANSLVSYEQQLVPRLTAEIPEDASEEEAAQIQAEFDSSIIAQYPSVQAVKETVDEALAFAEESGNEVVGQVSADITTAFTTNENGEQTRDDRGSESTLGNTVANMLLETLGSPERGGAEIGIVNAGGLRSELYYAPDGWVTFAEANSVLPFLNNLWTTSLTGAQFKELLEQQWQTSADGSTPSRAYIQLGFSNNVQYTFDAEAEQGSRITGITINGEPYDPAASYRIGTFSFLVFGGDNFRAFTLGTDARDSGLIDRDGWISYLQANQPLSPNFAKNTVGMSGLPSTLQAGETYTVEASKLQMTSLGSPEITSATVELNPVATGGSIAQKQAALSGAPLVGNATASELATGEVSDGNASITFTVPIDAQVGDWLTLRTPASGTVSVLPVSIEAVASTPNPSDTPTENPTDQPTDQPSDSATSTPTPTAGNGGLPDTGASNILPLGIGAAVLLLVGASAVAMSRARKNAQH